MWPVPMATCCIKCALAVDRSGRKKNVFYVHRIKYMWLDNILLNQGR